MKEVIQDLKNNKSTGGKIPVSMLEQSEFTFEFLKNYFNKSIEDGSFRDITPIFTNATPIFTKYDPLYKFN